MALTQDWRLSSGDAHADVQAENWLAALAAGLPAIGFDLGGLGRLVCATEADGSAVARDPRTGQEVRVVPLGVPVPPSFEMPISSFAAVSVPQGRPAPSGDTAAEARGPAVRRIAPAAHFPSAMPRPPGAGKPRPEPFGQREEREKERRGRRGGKGRKEKEGRGQEPLEK